MNLPNTEEPTRIKNFHDTLTNLHWSEEQRLENLKVIFNALHEIAANDLEYYNKHRDKSKDISERTIKASLTFGTLGAIITVLQSVKPLYELIHISSADMVVIGSAFFTIAAAALAWNKTLCVSGSHVRYVIAQFDLGKAITKFELDWQQWQNANNGTPPDKTATDAAFALFREFYEQIYKIIREDTQKWEKSIMDALTEQSNKYSSNTNNQQH